MKTLRDELQQALQERDAAREEVIALRAYADALLTFAMAGAELANLCTPLMHVEAYRDAGRRAREVLAKVPT